MDSLSVPMVHEKLYSRVKTCLGIETDKHETHLVTLFNSRVADRLNYSQFLSVLRCEYLI